MKFSMRFMKDGETIFRFVSEEITEEGLGPQHAEGMRQFRETNPELALWDITVGYESASNA